MTTEAATATRFAAGRGICHRNATLGGVEVRAHASWWLLLIIAGLVLGVPLVAVLHLPVGLAGAMVAGFGLALAVMALIHEGGHALVGARLGLEPTAVQAFGLGAATVYRRRATSPGQKALSAAAGPTASLLAALLSACVGVLTTSPLVAAVALGFAGLNAAYALINLIPSYPQDGGQLLHAVLWRLLDDESRALRLVGALGLGMALGILVVALLVGIQLSLVAGLLLGTQSLFVAIACGRAIVL
jgi:Zn-dependent protease